MRMFETKIKNSAGEPIMLNEQEMLLCRYNQKKVNDLGFQVDITTLTAISKRVVEQKFFEIAPADYFAVRVGEGAFMSEILTYKSYSIGGSFEQGVLQMGGNNGRLTQANTGVDSVSIKIKNWGREIGYTLMELAQAAKAGNWDLVTALEKARKTEWDLGIQRTAFLGGRSLPDVLGFLTQSDVTVNTTIMTAALKTMTPSQLKTFLETVISTYRSNSSYTAWPTHFTIPEDDYVGLASQSSPDFPIKSTLQLLTEAFATVCRNPNFKILPCAYATPSNSDSTLTYPRYVLSRYDEDSARMDIPVDYTATLANTINGFQYQNVGYGQFTGFKAYRPKEMLYLDLD